MADYEAIDKSNNGPHNWDQLVPQLVCNFPFELDHNPDLQEL